MGEKLLELKNLNMIFENSSSIFKKRKINAINDLDLSINTGDIIAMVGESGCGKTTIGKIITGVYKPSSGEVNYLGKNIWKMNKKEFKEYRRSVQMVHQDSYAALNPVRSIFESLSDPMIFHNIADGKAKARVELIELFKLVGLTPPEQFLDKYPHQLSGGQRQRILLARALSMKPKIIVADEPVSMVDVSLRISLLNLISEMNKKFNIAFIYITHDLATARYIASSGKLTVMYLGKMVENGDLQEIIRNPKHPYLQALLSAVPIPDPKKSRKMDLVRLKSLDMPDPANPPKGCRFNPRCPFGIEKCESIEPLLREYNGRMVACHLAEEIPEWKW